MARTGLESDRSLTFRELSEDAYSDWDRLACASSQGTVYHTAPWLQAISRLTQHKVILWGAYHEGRLVAGVPLQVRRKGPLSFAQRAFATPYGNAMVLPDLDASLHPNLLTAMKRLALRFSQLTVTATPYATPLEARMGWQATPRATYQLRSASLNGLWLAMASQVRNHIRVAEKKGISISAEPPAADFFEIYREVFQRQGLGIAFSSESFVRFLETLQDKCVGKVYTARMPDGTLCAACLVVRDNRRSYHSLAASHHELRKTGAPSLLVWEVLRDVLQTVDEFDFGGANVPHVAQFKSKFRGRLLEYPEFTHHRSLWEKGIIDCMRRVRSVATAGKHG